jgi:hypothetical protein
MRRSSGLPGVVSLSSMYLLVRRWLITSMILGTMSLISLSFTHSQYWNLNGSCFGGRLT